MVMEKISEEQSKKMVEFKLNSLQFYVKKCESLQLELTQANTERDYQKNETTFAGK